MRKVKRAGLILLGWLVLAGCGDGGDGDGNAGPIVSITPGATAECQLAYAPNPRTVVIGTTVTWRNDDTTPHTVTSSSSSGPGCTLGSGVLAFPPELDSGSISQGATFTHTFNTPGTLDVGNRDCGAVAVF